jgi:hypothetical protein
LRAHSPRARLLFSALRGDASGAFYAATTAVLTAEVAAIASAALDAQTAAAVEFSGQAVSENASEAAVRATASAGFAGAGLASGAVQIDAGGLLLSVSMASTISATMA